MANLPPIQPRTVTVNGLTTSWTTLVTVQQIQNEDVWIKPDILSVVNTSSSAVTFRSRYNPNSGDTVEFARVVVPEGGTVEVPVPNGAATGDAIQVIASAGSALDVAFGYYEVLL